MHVTLLTVTCLSTIKPEFLCFQRTGLNNKKRKNSGKCQYFKTMLKVLLVLSLTKKKFAKLQNTCTTQYVFPDSPMILDVSHELEVSHEEKKPLDREAVILHVPEYEKDIYQYLREAEVKQQFKKQHCFQFVEDWLN